MEFTEEDEDDQWTLQALRESAAELVSSWAAELPTTRDETCAIVSVGQGEGLQQVSARSGPADNARQCVGASDRAGGQQETRRRVRPRSSTGTNLQTSPK